ncbi:hypothetical protein Mp_6g08640 [Marchantia polymorpha subsp. ruderalis]|uniref:Uncharacterized protein n=2 Tax=Marchantia polymorpha TaxID=3197 RepID=A0AAF6BPZ0_MARPO|nr:hypothetical protein MARPO_0060s0057 [Marchantia polymorpha]BBN14074.1 hypothetical protein Mp_6g08640 [Marchantia polymorpha subsp. ruderalis]|eukprot:PTQ36971.1 hypothetical protein MARPO_0060s0057 [Marchantia polymorpha]
MAEAKSAKGPVSGRIRVQSSGSTYRTRAQSPQTHGKSKASSDENLQKRRGKKSEFHVRSGTVIGNSTAGAMRLKHGSAYLEVGPRGIRRRSSSSSSCHVHRIYRCAGGGWVGGQSGREARSGDGRCDASFPPWRL